MKRRALLALPAALAMASCSKQPDAAAVAPAAPATAASPPPANAAPAAAAATEAYAIAAQGHGFTVGVTMAANPVYVFFDATCPHCAQLWLSAKPLLNRIKMVWMPVGLLRASSGPQGATILSAPDPSAAMTENEAKVLDKSGGITVNPALGDAVLAQVKANTELFNKLGADSVPFIVFRHAGNGTPGTYAGALDTAGLSTLLGL
jgi:thiol:disulfide interchange protein DsbG